MCRPASWRFSYCNFFQSLGHGLSGRKTFTSLLFHSDSYVTTLLDINLKFHLCLSAAPRWLTAHPAAQTPPQCVFKASVSRLDVIVSSVLAGALISAVCVVEMALPARKCLVLWSVPGKHLTAFLLTSSQTSLHVCQNYCNGWVWPLSVSVSGLGTRML